jgi:hypothetical protein
MDLSQLATLRSRKMQIESDITQRSLIKPLRIQLQKELNLTLTAIATIRNEQDRQAYVKRAWLSGRPLNRLDSQ